MVGTLPSEQVKNEVPRQSWRSLTPAYQSSHRPAASQPAQRGTPDAIPTGFPALDGALGLGGLPRGRIVEFSGRPDSGHAALALRVLAQAQRQGGGKVAYVNLSGCFDAHAARRNGLNLALLTLGEPRDVEEALTMAEAVVRTGGPAALVLDVTNTLWVDADDARCIATSLRRLCAPLASSGTTLLVLSGLSGLTAFATFADVRLQVTHRRWIEREGVVEGQQVTVQVLKNRFAPPGGEMVLSMG